MVFYFTGTSVNPGYSFLRLLYCHLRVKHTTLGKNNKLLAVANVRKYFFNNTKVYTRHFSASS